MREAALQARAVSTAKIPAPSSPKMNSRRCPQRSPALPNDGPTTPKASIGPVMVHSSVERSLPRSVAIESSEFDRAVIVNDTVNRPERTTTSTAVRELRPTRREM